MSLFTDRMRFWQAAGFRPTSALDIGACVGQWTAEFLSVFPETNMLLVEANAECEPALERLGHAYHIAALSDRPKEASYYKIAGPNKSITGNSLFLERTSLFQNEYSVKTIMTTALDVLVPADVTFDFIKIDVQGAELDIMRGGASLVKRCQMVQMECNFIEYNVGAPLLIDVIGYMRSIGMTPIDLLEMHYMGGVAVQQDLMFVHADSEWAAIPNRQLMTLR